MAKDSQMPDAPPVTTVGELPPPSVVEQWTRKDLLDFTLIKDILEDPEDVTIFTHAKIDGRVFLLRDDLRFWNDTCHLPPGPSAKLADLAQRIKNMGKERSRGNAFHLGEVMLSIWALTNRLTPSQFSHLQSQ